jgi:hypothetical protein
LAREPLIVSLVVKEVMLDKISWVEMAECIRELIRRLIQEVTMMTPTYTHLILTTWPPMMV